MKAVIIFNLGGPDTLKNVKPFLFNLFNDKAIISLAKPFRYLLAKLVSSRRNLKAQDIYKHLGGGSPILHETQMQKDALQKALGDEYKVFIGMRYWHPMADEVLDDVIALNPDEIILLPLYPQYSMSTTGSFFTEWEEKMRAKNVTIPLRKVCCYPGHELFIQSYQNVIEVAKEKENIPKNARYLFSAHGLPKKNIEKGDPYEGQVHKSVKSIVEGLPFIKDHVVCYQSKVGPLEWLGPSTETEIKRASVDKVPVVIIPISFVSENSETLYELDYEYKMFANEQGIMGYTRVPTLRDNPFYIKALASMVENHYEQPCGVKGCKLVCRKLAA